LRAVPGAVAPYELLDAFLPGPLAFLGGQPVTPDHDGACDHADHDLVHLLLEIDRSAIIPPPQDALL
jgi:hypothetical protein